MAEKRKGGNTVNAVWELALPIAQDLGLELWDIRFQKEGLAWYLRIIIDKEGGVNIDDCVEMHNAIDAPLDELDPIEQSYNLQVSSPGVERDLIRDEHFKKFINAEIKLKLQKANDGVKEFTGILKAYSDGIISLERPDTGEIMSVERKSASWVRLDDFKDF